MSGDAEHEAGVLRVERRLAESAGSLRDWSDPQVNHLRRVRTRVGEA